MEKLYVNAIGPDGDVSTVGLFYCPILGGLKPSPLGDSFSTFSWQYDNVWG